jgi:hypothetical protein
MAHEIAHHIAAHGLGNDVAAHVLGDPITGRAGLTTALGEDQKPLTEVDPVTGQVSYVQNNLPESQADYNARKFGTTWSHA